MSVPALMRDVRRLLLDALKREMIADVIRGTRRDLTAERTRLTGARRLRRRPVGAQSN